MHSYLFFTAPWRLSLGGDETYYVGKSGEFLGNAGFSKASPIHLEALSGKIGMYTDYRPPGYPLLLAAFGVNSEDFAERKPLVASFQFALVLICATWVFFLAIKFYGNTLKLIPVGLALGMQPWIFQTTRNYLADSLTGSVYTLGLLCLIFSTFGGRPRPLTQFLAGTFLGWTVLLRPEMFCFALVPVLVAGVIAQRIPNRVSRPVIAAAVVLIFVFANFGYRYWFDGTIFARFRRAAPGIWAWSCTWPAYASEKQDIRFQFFYGELSFQDIPMRAISNDFEKEELRKAFQLRESRGVYDQKIDSIFQNLAATRIRRMPFKAFVLPRLFFTAQLWVNPFTNDFTGEFIKRIPDLLRKFISAFIVLLKMMFLLSGIVSVWFFFRLARWKDMQWFDYFWALAFTTVVFRTVTLGLIGASNEHRYMLMAWPSLTWCSLYTWHWLSELKTIGKKDGSEP